MFEMNVALIRRPTNKTPRRYIRARGVYRIWNHQPVKSKRLIRHWQASMRDRQPNAPAP